eukprot:182424-Prymnesium_polylepis.1
MPAADALTPTTADWSAPAAAAAPSLCTLASWLEGSRGKRCAGWHVTMICAHISPSAAHRRSSI